MKPLTVDPAEVEEVLDRINRPKAVARKPAVEKPAVVMPALKKPVVRKPGGEKPDIHYFKIRFAPGEIIVRQGVRSDFAGLLWQGCVQVHAPREMSPPRRRARPEECWNQPGLLTLRIERWVFDLTDRLTATEDGPMSRRDRATRCLARKLRAGLQRLEDWAVARTDRARQADRNTMWTRGQAWIARTFFGWTRRRFRERSLATPLLTESAGKTQKHEKIIGEITACDENGNERDVMERFMGLTGALWNVPRSCTLVAQNDAAGRPCELWMVNRKKLLHIYEQSAHFRDKTDERFLATELASLLVENRLFRNTFAEADIADWPRFLDQLRGKAATPHPEAVRRVRHWLTVGSPEFRRWIEEPPALDKAAPIPARDRYQLIGALNTLLKRDDLDSSDAWPDPGAEARRLRNQRLRRESETIRLNHLLVAQAFEDVMRTDLSRGADRWPLRPEQFQELIGALRAGENGSKMDLRHYERDQVIFEQDADSVELHLIVSGTVRITKRELGGEVLVNQLERHGFFGIASIEDGGKHSARIVALTAVNTVALDRKAVGLLMQRYPALEGKLRGDLDRLRRRDALMKSLDRLPPAEPPAEVASKLMLAGNLLRIDMDLCTRCDQCVQACAAAHDGVPRFARSNPDPSLRFGRWAVAAACVHCNDPPCQSACPVGAIAFLDSGAVQVHRDRCTGCEQCVPACPFEVIAMVLPPTKLESAGAKDKPVATKCDLCLTVGRDPPCVVSCPYGAAERGTPRELFPEIKSWAEIFSPR